MAERQRHHVFFHLGERAYGTRDIELRNWIFLLAIDATDQMGCRIDSVQRGAQIQAHHQELSRNAHKALVDESWRHLKFQPKNRMVVTLPFLLLQQYWSDRSTDENVWSQLYKVKA